MPRLEDRRLITGEGRYAGDIKLDSLVHAAFCRSTLPHTRIRAVDRSGAAGMAGVIAVWTADDVPEVAAGLTDFTPADI
jgi:carbon-monoxide dehydrogenase large subunit